MEFSENICDKYSNPVYCYINIIGIKTWSVISIILLLLLYLLKFNKKILHIWLCVIILNSINGFLLLNFLAREKILETFKLTPISLTLIDLLTHVIPLILILLYHKIPKLTILEIIKGITIVGTLFVLYNVIFDIDDIYISFSIIKLSKYIVVPLYIILFSLILIFMNYYLL